jgi:ribonuclease PH
MRPDGRANDELREVSIETGFTDVPMGSVLIRAGRTTVLCTASVDEDVPRWMRNREPVKGWVTGEYSMLPGSSSPRASRESMRGKVKGRTHEIQRLIGRSMRAVMDLEALGARMITIDCDVLQADGGTRTASITGGFVALALACGKLVEDGTLEALPLKDTIAAVSCGLLEGEGRLDLPYVEDAAADVDMNVVMTGSGRMIEVQGTGEEATFTRAELDVLLDLAEGGIAELTKIQRAALPEGKLFDDLFGL